MSEIYCYDIVFEKIETLTRGEYECCTFVECDFSKQDFSDFVFIDCSFRECNLSLVNLHKSVIRDVEFSGCKMMGLRGFGNVLANRVVFSLSLCNLCY